MCNDNEKYSSSIRMQRNLPLEQKCYCSIDKRCNKYTCTVHRAESILLYSLAQRHRPSITQEAVFTEEDESRFQKRFQEGSDITSDN